MIICGIVTVPIIMAVRFKIPLIIWGETEWDIAGIYGPEDIVEFSNRSRHENSLRGYEWYDFINDKNDQLIEKDFRGQNILVMKRYYQLELEEYILAIFLNGKEKKCRTNDKRI